MPNEIAKTAVSSELMEKVLVTGDLSKLTPGERLNYYKAVCDSVGLNPLTRPFDYITLNGRLTLYARKDATDQLRKKHGVSVTLLDKELVNDAYAVTAYGKNQEGREDVATGIVFIGGLKGDAVANAMMKAETKAKRRLTLSLCGLGFLDESEAETIPNAKAVVVTETGEIVTPPVEKKPIGDAESRKNFNDVARSAMAKGMSEAKVREILEAEGDYAKAASSIISEL